MNVDEVAVYASALREGDVVRVVEGNVLTRVIRREGSGLWIRPGIGKAKERRSAGEVFSFDDISVLDKFKERCVCRVASDVGIYKGDVLVDLIDGTRHEVERLTSSKEILVKCKTAPITLKGVRYGIYRNGTPPRYINRKMERKR